MAHADPAPSEEDLGEQGYYLDSLRGVHQSLSFMGKPPLFILKDEWEASPPAKEKSYHQILDPRTRAFMKVAKQEEIEIQPVALVQWKVPHAGPGLNTLNPKSGEKGPEPEYTIKVAMMNADVMGVGADDEEELDVVSSDDEDGILLRKGKNQVENDSLTVYYPLIPMPCRHRGKELRKVLSLADENSGAIGRVAMEWLDEIKRVDKFPNIHNEG